MASFDASYAAEAKPLAAIAMMKPHDSHPALGHLVLLVFEAVMEVVCVSLPGYIIARLGHFDADKQKFLANLNVMLFTPCLIFTKLASQLNADKFAELGVIPIIFVVMTFVSYTVSVVVSRLFRFNRRATNFVIAMGVFGNSNSLPISLVISLSQTLKGLHWDKIPGDNDDEVAARGILYLMIFQQLGQLVRWSWGYHVLLAPKSRYEEYNQEAIEEGRYRDDPDGAAAEGSVLIDGLQDHGHGHDDAETAHSPTTEYSEGFEPAGRTPVASQSHGSSSQSQSDSDSEDDGPASGSQGTPKNAKKQHRQRRNGNGLRHSASVPSLPDTVVSDATTDYDVTASGHSSNNNGGIGTGILSFPRIRNINEPDIPSGLPGLPVRLQLYGSRASHSLSSMGRRSYGALPGPAQQVLAVLQQAGRRVYAFLWEFMNPPLWAMLLAVVVASFPRLQQLFFQEGSFIRNSVTSAVTQSAGVAVPLILVVLGANLARNTQKRTGDGGEGDDQAGQIDPEEAEMGSRLLVAALVCRMLLPTLIMAPILALVAKYVPVSIVDDPIFVIVCFLLTGAPSALQLAQICQINGVFEATMSKVLFQSYVVWILPSTLVLVMCALEVVEWAQ